LKQVVVCAVNKRYLGGRFPESLGGRYPTESGTNNDNSSWIHILFASSPQPIADDSKL
jgi:hypothetical protein